MSESLGDRPAFPHEADYVRGEDPNTYVFQVPFDPGMSTRVYLVGQALAGGDSGGLPSDVAKRAVTIAKQALALLEEEQ